MHYGRLGDTPMFSGDAPAYKNVSSNGDARNEAGPAREARVNRRMRWTTGSALVNQDPVVVIETRFEKPEWGARLNAWIAAWNRGGRVEAGKKVRLQAPVLPRIVVDGDSIREFRLLIESLMNRVEDSVKERSAWWAEEKIRERRVNLLKPYNLRFHMSEDGTIQIILFNGRYASYHREFVMSISGGDEEWERRYSCSMCKLTAKAGHTEGKLTSSGE